MDNPVIEGRAVNINTVVVDGIDSRDFPDFSDAFVLRAKFIDGSWLSNEQLELLADQYPEMLFEMAAENMMSGMYH